MTTSDDTTQIPYGYCHCGCGQKTGIAQRTNPKYQTIKGEHVRYIKNHVTKLTHNQRWVAFWNEVRITSDDNLCWEWQGACDKDGYGNKTWQNKRNKTHHLAWSYPDYVIPSGMLICHSCDNRKCCNPKHLFLGTNQDNMSDMVAKNRQAKGEADGNAKLTAVQVREIRHRYALGNVYQYELAAEYGVHLMTIAYIIRRITWKHEA